ncbi:patched domain-containing protein 3 isoform X1 [Pocillopora verrucosa]|uniref:patched domain-containing protein 3 isoform X1 n=2 Tax=Pocillopora verrucosa TaxID=203993 RepID=UPI003340E17F
MDSSSASKDGTENKKCQCLNKVSNFITGSMEKGFYRLGKAVGGNPWISILISLIICGGCAAGLINFTQEARGDKLWTPEDSTTQKHKLWVDENFPLEVRFSTALLVAGDVLTPAVLKEALMIQNKVTKIGNGTDISWEKFCFRVGPVCSNNGLLELWSFNETLINSLTKEEILKKINQPVIISPVTKKRFVLSQYLGGIKKNESGYITKAEATSMSYGIKYTPELNKNTGALEDKNTNEWEEKFGKLMDAQEPSSAELYYYTRLQDQTDSGDSIQGDVQLLSIGYILIIIYVAVMLGRLSRLNIKAWLALLGVICIGLAIGVSFGLASAFGVFYGPVHSTLPFLLLGIGVDDMFVIVQAWNNLSPDTHKNQEIAERIGLALKHAGCSITITSLTDFLAFMIGATTILPALRSFCLFAGIGILADFALQATMFTAFLALDARRQNKNRDGCCCCIKLRDDYTESERGKRDLLQEFMDKYVARALLSLPGKIVVIIITGTLFGVNLYGTLMLRQYFDRIWFLPVESMSYKYSTMNTKYFPVDGRPANIYTGKFEYFENQGKLHGLYDLAVSDEYVVASSVNSWYEEYIDWAKKVKPGQVFDQSSSKWKINSKTEFYKWLNEFLKGPGISYRNDVRMKNGTGSTFEITATRMRLTHKDMDSTQTEVKAMEDLREKVGEVFPDELAFPYSFFYLGWETNKVISEELFRNMGLALMTVFLVTLLVLANLWTCLLVFTCVGFTLVNITGTMHFWGLTIDTVSTICLVLAVGLSVDYASHVGHTFMIIPGSRTERARATLRDIGPAVWNGGFSTFLAVFLLAFSNSYVFKTFFKVFFCVVVYGLFHGLCYLPVLLSAIGPAPYESAQSHHDGKGTRSRSPVHPTGLPGDNVSYELAVANGKGTPQKSAQNGGYPIPPPEYQGVDTSNLANGSKDNQAFKSSVATDLNKA